MNQMMAWGTRLFALNPSLAFSGVCSGGFRCGVMPSQINGKGVVIRRESNS